MKNKKGAIQELQALIVPLIGIAITLVIGFLIFSEAKVKIVDLTGTSTTLNQTITFVNNTLTNLESNCMTLSCSSVVNQTGTSPNGTIPTACYTCEVGGITVKNYSDTCVPYTTLNVTFSCKYTSIAFNATSDVQNATQDIPGWLPIIVITIIGAILIGLVMRFRGQ